MYCHLHGEYHTLCVPCQLGSPAYSAGPTDTYYPPGAGKEHKSGAGQKVEVNWKPLVKKKDMVNSPSHYTAGEIECIDAIKEVVKHLDGMEAMCTGNAIKYLWRWKHKNGTEDLKKAVWYIQRMIDEFDTN